MLGLFRVERETLEVTISPARVELLGISTSTSVIVAWIVIAALAVFAILVRVLAIPRFQETPRGLQLVLETAVGAVSDFTKGKFGGRRNEALAATFRARRAVRRLGLRGTARPSAAHDGSDHDAFLRADHLHPDQLHGHTQKGVRGHLANLQKPNALVTPFKFLSEIAIPISLACRLFGNMLGGMIVVDLVYMALGAFSVGIPAVLGLYFNAFHPLIQFFIFINLSLTFIGEAAE